MRGFITNKKIIVVMSFFACIFLAIMLNTSVQKAKKDIKLPSKKINLYKGDSYKFKLKNCTYKSTNKKVVSISKTGKIKARKVGNAKIIIEKINSKSKVTCKIKVGKHVKSVVPVGAATVLLRMGQSYTVKANVLPSKVLYKKVSFSTTENKIISIDSKGVITPLSAGVATVNIVSKATNSKGKKVTAKVTIVVQADNTNTKPDLGEDMDDFKDVIIVPTKAPTSIPTDQPTDKPTEVPTETPTDSPTDMPEVTPTTPVEKPTMSPPTEVPTEMPTVVPTVEPTKKPMTVEELIASTTPDPNSPLVLSFVVSDSSNNYRTVYLFNKDYAGVMSVTIDGYSYTKDSSILEFLEKLQKETGSATNSAGTVTVERKTKKESWKVILHEKNKTYYFSGRINDSTYNSPYGIMIAEGNTLDSIIIK